MVDGDVKRALLSAYRNSIIRYQKLLKTHLAEVERDYIKQRLSACDAAVKALSGPEATAICIWKPKYLAESRPRRAELQALDQKPRLARPACPNRNRP